MSDLFEPETFQEIRVGNIGVMAAGGIVDISRPEDARGHDKVFAAQQFERRTYLSLNPDNARRVAAALVAAADACGQS